MPPPVSQGIASANAALRLEVAAMDRELELIARQRYVEQQARAYGVGGSRETAFTLSPEAPPLPADAPGSAAGRVGARARRHRPRGALADGPVRPIRLGPDRYPVLPARSRRSRGGQGADDRHPGRGLHLRRLRARRWRPAADHGPRRRHPRRDLRLRRRRRVAHAAAAVVRVDVRGRRAVRDPGARRARRRRQPCGAAGSGSSASASPTASSARSAGPRPPSPSRRPISSAHDAFVQVGIPAGRYGSVLVKAEGQTHEFSATSSVDIATGAVVRVSGVAGSGLIVEPIASVGGGAPHEGGSDRG